MTNPDDLAFSELVIENDIVRHGGGLTKREYFAGQVIQNPHVMNMVAFGDEDCRAIARRVIVVADALIAELNKEKP